MVKKKGNILVVVLSTVLIVSVGVFGYFFLQSKKQVATPLTWEECINNPNHRPMMELFFPLICRLSDGRSVIQPLSDEEKKKLQPPTNNKVTCGGWDTSGEIICKCSGEITKQVCPAEAASCDAGSYFCSGSCGTCCYKGVGENSKYSSCDTNTTSPSDQNPQGTFCGGFAGKPCAAGYKCQLDGNYPDAGGKCTKN